MLKETLAIILAGGEGKRLYPLTRDRAKPAVPFGGKYRIIDFALTNCLHSGIHRILVLTQYKSHSLQKHLRDGWSIFNPELGEYITPVPPQMRTGGQWYSGTADAIYQNLYLVERSNAAHTLILSGDHIYRMDYAAMLEFHCSRGNDLTIACMEVPLSQASQFGIVNVDDDLQITSFTEKPTEFTKLSPDGGRVLASMGIYLFSTRLLIDMLQEDHRQADSGHDFGCDVIPRLIETHKVNVYRFGGEAGRVSPDQYWRDVGTIDSFYDANMELLQPVPKLDLYQEDWPIRTYQQQTPPARTVPGHTGTEGIFINSIVSGGGVIAGGSVQTSILFPDCYIGDHAFVEDSILFEGVQIANGARVRRCIIDKHVQVPPAELIGYDPALDRERFTISDLGIVIVPKGYRFPGT